MTCSDSGLVTFLSWNLLELRERWPILIQENKGGNDSAGFDYKIVALIHG